jgi:potassium-transporting ATPase KdpC subunit
MKKTFQNAFLFTVVTTILLGLAYPLLVTVLAQMLFPFQANGQLIRHNGGVVGSRIIGQPFSGPGYFHPRPSAAGAGYDATASGGSNLGPTNRKLIARVQRDVERLQGSHKSWAIPVDLVTTSGSGLDPDISLASAYFQVPRVAHERGLSEKDLREMVRSHVEPQQLDFLGEPRVNVLLLNLDLDEKALAKPKD